MIKGLYTSASGMLPHVRKQEVLANNLANAATAGYKKDEVFTRELSRAERKQQKTRTDWEQPLIDQVYTDFTPGVFDCTNDPLNLAIEGDGFFTLETADGQTVLTRSGTFEVSSDGQLSFPGGAVLRGESGPIEVGNGKLTVSASGEVEVDGVAAGRIVPRTVADLTKLQKIGSASFVVPEGVELITVPDATIRQGYLEAANVDIVSEMIDMITSYRNYEANARAVQTQDSTLEQLFNRVGGKG